MAWVNGIHEAGIYGTLGDFFTTLKTSILENTDFEFIESESSELQLAFNTCMKNIKLIIKDYNITDSSSTTTSSSIMLYYYRDETLLASYADNYSSSTYACSKLATRVVKFFTFKSDGIQYICWGSYNATASSYGLSNLSIAKIQTTNISTGEQVIRNLVGAVCYDENNVLAPAYINSTNIMNNVGTDGNGGAIILNHIVYSSPTTLNSMYPPIEYCNSIYCSSYVGVGSRYKINGKYYFAISSHILLAE